MQLGARRSGGGGRRGALAGVNEPENSRLADALGPQMPYGQSMQPSSATGLPSRPADSRRVFCALCEHTEFVHGGVDARRCLTPRAAAPGSRSAPSRTDPRAWVARVSLGRTCPITWHVRVSSLEPSQQRTAATWSNTEIDPGPPIPAWSGIENRFRADRRPSEGLSAAEPSTNSSYPRKPISPCVASQNGCRRPSAPAQGHAVRVSHTCPSADSIRTPPRTQYGPSPPHHEARLESASIGSSPSSSSTSRPDGQRNTIASSFARTSGSSIVSYVPGVAQVVATESARVQSDSSSVSVRPPPGNEARRSDVGPRSATSEPSKPSRCESSQNGFSWTGRSGRA